MPPPRILARFSGIVGWWLLVGVGLPLAAEESPPEKLTGAFEAHLGPLIVENCKKCHRGKRPKGQVDLAGIATREQLLEKPELIVKLIDVLESQDMPPENEAQPSEAERVRALQSLQAMLREVAATAPPARVPIRRLNRFQYNNCVRDLFELDRDVFQLSEKLMTRYGNWLTDSSRVMPDRVEVECRSLREEGGLRGVTSYPKDLRAAHGFDNQANQLTLSPLLLDAFLRLSVSIVESPDFNAETVGIWNAFFAAPPPDTDAVAEAEKRIGRFLRVAFRGTVDEQTLQRYAGYARSKLGAGLSFTGSMKSVASAALCSPRFLFRFTPVGERSSELALARRLAFFLWGSAPDEELLRVAESGRLSRSDGLDASLERLLKDPRIERFLDAFPTQWMQLEGVLAATPDPARHRLFHIDPSRPASLQMVLEPLLLFDAVFVEDRAIDELIAPSFAYRSEFLRTWYGSDLEPPAVDEAAVAVENSARERHIEDLRRGRELLETARLALDESLPDRIEKMLETFDAQSAREAWESEQQGLLKETVAFGNWHRIGPFEADNFDEAHTKEFIEAGAVDLTKKRHGKRWTEEMGFVDGKVHELVGANCATYLYREVQSGAARPIEVSLGTDDSFKIWLNGELIIDKRITRGVAPNQDKVELRLEEGRNRLLLKVANGGGGYGFWFQARDSRLSAAALAALRTPAELRSRDQQEVLSEYWRSTAPELAAVREAHAEERRELERRLREADLALERAPKPQDLEGLRRELRRRFDDEMRSKLRSRVFERDAAVDPRYGGIITNGAMLSMTSGPDRTHPIARGAWIIEVIFNDPPPPPPNDVPALDEDASAEHQTIREKFAVHRENPDCAGCHARLDPLGFAMESYDITGRWRDRYENGRDVDASGTLLRRYSFDDAVQFKQSLMQERRRFAKAFTEHLLRFALSRELLPHDSLTVESIVTRAEAEEFRLRALIRHVVLSEAFLQP